MLYDLAAGAPARLEADVAVIGAGAAGLTIARRLLAAGLSVIVLESGGTDYEPASAGLNRGENLGEAYYPLDHARLRFFGGTTAIWGGRVAMLDEIDFEKRDWVPHSGWPIGLADLRSYYAEARQVFGLPRDAPTVAALPAGLLPAFSDDEIATPLWSFDDQFDRFAFSAAGDLLHNPRCTLVVHATVREIVANDAGSRVSHLDVRSLNGGMLIVGAREYVLAAGGIENPRLLLASTSVKPQGLGNDHDQVGRYFMEHPHARGGRVVRADTWRLLAAVNKRYVDGVGIAPLFAASEALQKREGLLNTSLTLGVRPPATGAHSWGMQTYLRMKQDTAPDNRGRAKWRFVKRGTHFVQRYLDPARPWLQAKLSNRDVALVVRAEQAPNPNSRVLLSTERDALGTPRAALDWRTSPLDVHSVRGLVASLGRELNRLGLGEVEAAPWLDDPTQRWMTDPLISPHPIGGYHHIGTTRMSSDPKLGVTDAQGTVHGIGNLHIAGSSLFPTSGWANPTLTIVALALRTADYLIRRSDAVEAVWSRADAPNLAA